MLRWTLLSAMLRQKRKTLLSALILTVSCLLCLEASADNTQSVVQTIASRSLFFETFDSDDWGSRWKHSAAAKYNGRFITEAGRDWANKGLKIPEKNKYYGLTALLAAPVDPLVVPTGSPGGPLPLVVQYEVRYSGGVSCGGAYLKLLSADPGLAAEALVDSTPYSIMFGPDRCGGPGKVHLIFRHRNPLNGTVTEKHLASPPVPESNDHTHVYTLRLFPDHKYEVLVDGSAQSSGSLLDPAALQPPLLPPREVPDPEDSKPEDWVDAEKIPDPAAVKPDDWDDREQVPDDKAVRPRGWLEDEPDLINDPAAKRPADWDDEEDGTWEPNQIPNPRCKKVGCGPWVRPMKPNPAYKGAWRPPLIDNPDYKGPWVQRRIPNPHFFEDPQPLATGGVAPIGAVALELWTVDEGYMFDNILITRDPAAAELAVDKLWKPRHEAEVKASEARVKALQKEEQERKKKEEQAEKKKKGHKGGRRHSRDQLEQVTEKILGLFEEGAVLAPLAPALAPLLSALRDSPENTVLLLGLTPLLGLTLAMILKSFRGGKKESTERADGGAEGEAAGGAGDAGGAEGEAAEGQGAAAADAPSRADGGAPSANGEAHAAAESPQATETAQGREEITADAEKEEEEEEEDGEEGTPAVRRRTRRAA